MFDWFKKKPVEEKKPEKKSAPIYNQFVSNEKISDLKLKMVKSISEGVPPVPKKLSSADKKELINFYLNFISNDIKRCVAENKEYLHLFGSHLPSGMIRAYYDKYNASSYNTIFAMISDDLYNVLQDIGIKAMLPSDKGSITIRVSDLKKFCNYEKLIALK